MTECDHTKPSRLVEGHDHTCNGAHLEGYLTHDGLLHKCSAPTCRRWFS